jgi:hypothetical protein
MSEIELRLYCRAGDVYLGSLLAPARPARGDLIRYGPPEHTGFAKQYVWRVDSVVWNVAKPGSTWVSDRIRAGQITQPVADGWVSDVDVLLWPEQGPFWDDRPDWAPQVEEDDSE